jgi:hypothetical protein
MKYGKQIGAAAVITGTMLAISTPAVADPMKGCYGATYSTLEVLEIADDHMVVIYSAFGTGYVLEDASSPIHGMAGPCTGALELKGGVLIDETGKCVRTDADGDKILIFGVSEGDGSKGTWGMEGLTGKFVGATGSGTWWMEADDGNYYLACFDGSWKPAM